MDDIPSPALSDEELRETLELFSTVLASVSDRVDAQTSVLDQVNKTATEARQAAFAARSQTSTENFGAVISNAVGRHLEGPFQGMTNATEVLANASGRASVLLDEATGLKLALFRELEAREQKAVRLRWWLPWLGLGAVVLALAMTLGLPRFLAGNSAGCAVLGGEWFAVGRFQERCEFLGEDVAG